MSKIIQVLLADDHPALRVGLRVLLEQAPDITVVAEASTGREALAQIEALRPDVAVLDCQLPGLTGAEVAAAVQQRGLPTRVLALSAYKDQQYVRPMVAAGAVGYLLKEEAPGTIVAAVRAAGRGEGWFSPAVAAQVAAWARGPSAPGLSTREVEVLRLVVAGKTNREIGLALAISEKTVEKHLQGVFAKLGVASRVEAAVRAVQERLA